MVKHISQKISHSLFHVGIITKALISVVEIISGCAFVFLSYDKLYSIIFMFFGGELTENPRDFVWEIIAKGFHDFSTTPQSVWAFILLSHGIIKIFLLAGLWNNKQWAYPASIIAFTLFIIYQFYQLFFTPSIILWLITIIDIIVLLLIISEYRHRRNILLAI